MNETGVGHPWLPPGRAAARYSVPKALTRERTAGIVGLGTAVALTLLAAANALGWTSTPLRAGESAGLLPAIDLAVLALIAALAPYGVLRALDRRRLEAIERRFPEFLQDVAEAGRFGRPLTPAILSVAQGRYGPLSAEVRKLAAEAAWGVPIGEALERLADRLPSPVVRRSIGVLVRAEAAGGQYADVLTRVAHDARAERLAQERRRASTATYVLVVYIAFAVFLLTAYILAALFLPQMIAAGSATGASGFGIGTSIGASLGIALLLAVLLEAVGGGLIAGIIYRGRAVDGLPHLVLLLAAGWVVMRFVVPLPGGLG